MLIQAGHTLNKDVIKLHKKKRKEKKCIITYRKKHLTYKFKSGDFGI